MHNFFSKRLLRKQFIYAFLILVTIAVAHAIYVIDTLGTQITYRDTPYTKWLLVDNFSGFSIIYLLLLPIIVSVATGDVYIQDKQNGFLHAHITQQTRWRTWLNYSAVSSLYTALIVIVSLVVNVVILFCFLPNISPDPIINKGSGLNGYNTLFISGYYHHPYLHIAWSILHVALCAMIYNLLAISLSIVFNKRIVAFIGVFCAQMMLIILNQFLPRMWLIPPVYFLQNGTPFIVVNMWHVLFTYILMLLCIMIFKKIGDAKYEIG